MALHQLMSIDLGVPQPDALAAFYREIGFVSSAGGFGSAEQPDQIRITETPFRQFHRMRIACDTEADLADAQRRLQAIGLNATRADTILTVTDPINRWTIEVAPQARATSTVRPERPLNRPGVRGRVNARADVITETIARTPRRLGHVVLGSPDPKRTVALLTAVGFRVSDTIGGGMATFLRCSPDHHNVLVAPAPAPYLNHYALEQDDFDAVMKSATRYLAQHGQDRHVAGPGRHTIGGNVFWYLCDPAGNYCEFFTDMDQIVGDHAWQAEDWAGADHWSVWGELKQPEAMFRPADMRAIIQGWQAAGSSRG